MNQDLYKLMVNASKDYISLIDRNYVYVEANDAYLDARNLSRDDVIGKAVTEVWGDKVFGEFIKEKLDQSFKGEIVRYQSIFEFRENEVNYMDVTFYPIQESSAEVTHCVVVSHNLTEIKRSEERIKHLEYYDALTGLPNRLQFLDRLALELSHAKRNRNNLAVLFLDLDLFANINESYGYKVGDTLLKEVSARMNAVLRQSDTVTRWGSHFKYTRGTLSRFGGDEFAMIIPNLDHSKNATVVCDRLRDKLKKPFLIEGKEIFVSSCIGIAIYPDDGEDENGLMKNADIALHKAKGTARDTTRFYSSGMNEEVVKRVEMENLLFNALGRNEFVLYYQPQFDIKKREIFGVEALLRWIHPVLGLVSPLDFISLAEESGLIVELGEWVLNQACSDLERIHKKYGDHIRLSVNLSSRQFTDNDLLSKVTGALGKSSVDPGLLELEITESSLMRDLGQTLDVLNKLKQLGVKIALDDFGTGYSSLTYLKRFPIDTLKIDQGFLKEMETDGDDAAIVRGIIRMAHELSIEVIAEGVETEAHLVFLEENRCRLIQGFYLCGPVPLDELPETRSY